MGKEEINNWKYFQRIGLIVAIIASIGTLIGVYFQIQTKNIKLELRLLSVDYLTTNNNIDNLTSNYKYTGIPVKNLWLVKYKIINTGDITIIGKGVKKNIIGDNIKIRYKTNVQILDNIKIIQKELPIDIIKKDSVSFAIYFDQWRVNEFVVFSVYLKSDKKINDFLPYVVNRPIIDGDILIYNYTNKAKKENIPIIDYFPSPIPLIIRILTIIVILAILILLAIISIKILIEWLKYNSWKRKYYNKFKEFIKSELLKEKFMIKSKGKFSKEEINRIIEYPWLLEDEYWKYFEGKKIPVKHPVLYSWKGFISHIFLLLFVIIICSLIILSIVKY